MKSLVECSNNNLVNVFPEPGYEASAKLLDGNVFGRNTIGAVHLESTSLALSSVLLGFLNDTSDEVRTARVGCRPSKVSTFIQREIKARAQINLYHKT